MLSEIVEARRAYIDDQGRIPGRAYVTTSEYMRLGREAEETLRYCEPLRIEGMLVTIRDEAGPRVGL